MPSIFPTRSRIWIQTVQLILMGHSALRIVPRWHPWRVGSSHCSIFEPSEQCGARGVVLGCKCVVLGCKGIV